MLKLLGGVLITAMCLAAARIEAAEMTVSAAASLTDSFNELARTFEKKHPGAVIYSNYAASNPLLRQIMAGAPVDVFASADTDTMDKAVTAGVVDPASLKIFASNNLVLIVPRGSPRPENLADLPKMQRMVIGNPDSVPAGRYARAALEKAGVWNALQDRLILAASVRQALDYIARGEADAGIVYGTDAKKAAGKVETAFAVEGHAPVKYPAAVALTGQNPALGAKFLEFVMSQAGQDILAKYGFGKP